MKEDANWQTEMFFTEEDIKHMTQRAAMRGFIYGVLCPVIILIGIAVYSWSVGNIVFLD